jgi:hypothetical protein
MDRILKGATRRVAVPAADAVSVVIHAKSAREFGVSAFRTR